MPQKEVMGEVAMGIGGVIIRVNTYRGKKLLGSLQRRLVRPGPLLIGRSEFGDPVVH